MFLLASASASCNLPLTLVRGFFICLLVCLLFSNLLYDLDDLYPNGKCLIFHLSQFLLRTKKKTLRPRDDHQGCSLLSTFEDPLFGGGVVQLVWIFFCSWSPSWSSPCFIAHNNVLSNRVFIYQVPQIMPIWIPETENWKPSKTWWLLTSKLSIESSYLPFQFLNMSVRHRSGLCDANEVADALFHSKCNMV